MKKFWKKTEGFTLVELIVVIAILGILAGVGTVGYSGYIKKANMAADRTLVSAVNNAFSAACIENGVLHTSINVAEESWNEKAINGLASISGTGVTEEKASAIIASFANYYAGNMSSKFKTTTDLMYFNGTFSLPGDATSVELPGGGTLTLTPEQVALIKASTYSKDVGGLMGQIDGIGSLVAALMDVNNNPAAAQALMGYMGSDAYLTSMISALGGNVNAENLGTEYAASLTALVNTQVISKLAEEFNVDPDEIDVTDDKYIERYNELRTSTKAEVDKNLLVLGIAQSAATQSKDSAMAIINSTTPKADLLEAMLGGGSGTANGMGNAALVYGAFTAYAKSDSATDTAKSAINNASDPTAVFDVLDNPDELKEFQKYMATDQGKTDMDACIAAMGVVNNAASDSDTVNGVLTEGFANNDFVSALETLLK